MEKIKLDIQKFASSGSVNTSTTDDSYFFFNWQQASQSTPNNSTTINWQAGVVAGHNYYSNAVKLGAISANGTQVYGGGTFSNINRGTHQLASGSLTITHNNDGQKSFGVSFSGWVYEGSWVSGSKTFELNKINRTTIDSFQGNDINGIFKVNYTTYGGNYTYKLRISIPSVGALEKIDNYVSGTNFQLSQDSLDYIYNYTSTKNQVQLGAVIEAWSGNTKAFETSELKNMCNITNADPIFNTYQYYDINPITLELTGNAKYNINNYSTARAKITPTNKAIAQKGATMVKYRLVIGNSSIDADYSDDNNVYLDIENSPGGTYNVYAIDSRNNSTLVTKLATSVINYQPMTLVQANASVERTDEGVGSNCILKFNGTIWKGNFGAVNNSVINTIYRFKKTNETSWQVGTTSLVPTINDNGTYNFEAQIRSNNPDYTWDLNASYDIHIELFDKLSSVSADFVLPSAIPNISLATEGVGIMCDYDENLGGLLQVSGQVIGEGFTPVVKSLWTGNQNSGNITLSDSISNYDFILVGSQAYNANGYWNKGSILIPVSNIEYATDQHNNYNIAIVQSSSVYAEIQFRFENNKKITIVSTHNSGWSSTYLKYVIGINLTKK